MNYAGFTFVFSLLFVFPVWGDEGAKVQNEATAAKSSYSAGPSEKIDLEIVKAEEGVKADSSNPSAHIRLAYLLIGKGALDEAMKSFDEAIRLNPRSHDAKTGKGIVLARMGNQKEAEKVLKDALILNPNPVRTYYELGLLYRKLGEVDKAIAAFKEGIKKHDQGRM